MRERAFAHGERLTLGIEYFEIPSVDCHAGAYSLPEPRSTGAMLPRWRCARALGSSALRAIMNSRRGCGGGIGSTWGDRQDDAGSKGVAVDPD